MNENISTISKCPEWCVSEHSEMDPANSGNCDGPDVRLEGIWNESIGKGQADALLQRYLDSGVEHFHLDVQVEDAYLPSELIPAAEQFERLAAELRRVAAETH